MKQGILGESKNNEFILEWYPLIRMLRDNDRHFTYLSEVNWKSVVVKVAKTEESAVTLRKEIRRINKERWESISWATILRQWDNYFVATKYNKTVGELVDEFEKEDNEDWLRELFRIILDWTTEISEEINDELKVKTMISHAENRIIKYVSELISAQSRKHTAQCLCEYEIPNPDVPELPIELFTKAWGFFDSSKSVINRVCQNHACLHLGHLFVWDENSWKLVAIDWEHSEIQPYRMRFLDEAYIFQNLLHRHSEESARIFYEEFIKKYWQISEKDELDIKLVFTKKLLGWLYEIITDSENNKQPGQIIGLHLKYLKYFLEAEDISSI